MIVTDEEVDIIGYIDQIGEFKYLNNGYSVDLRKVMNDISFKHQGQ